MPSFSAVGKLLVALPLPIGGWDHAAATSECSLGRPRATGPAKLLTRTHTQHLPQGWRAALAVEPAGARRRRPASLIPHIHPRPDGLPPPQDAAPRISVLGCCLPGFRQLPVQNTHSLPPANLQNALGLVSQLRLNPAGPRLGAVREQVHQRRLITPATARRGRVSSC